MSKEIASGVVHRVPEDLRKALVSSSNVYAQILLKESVDHAVGQAAHTASFLVVNGIFTSSMTPQKNNPLHGVTLKTIMEYLFEKYGWEELARSVRIKCFQVNPSITSSLTFLRKTPWAREKVERLYLNTMYREKRESKRS